MAFSSCDLLDQIFPGQGTTVEVESLEIEKAPNKTEYIVGEKFDPTGMVVKAVYADGEKKEVTDYTYSPDGALEKKHTKITITWGELKVTQKITVKNDAVSVLIETPPTKTVYMQGETFDPTGMVLSVTYQNGETEKVQVKDNATYPTTSLKIGDTKIIVTYGGIEVEQPIEIAKGVFIEAENGIINSASGKAYTDAVGRDEEHDATGGLYVGDMKANDSITFVFSADKAGKGDIAFRMASQYLKADSNWTPIWMGDCQFNKICEFYVNGIKYEIPDSAVLPGGGEAGGAGDATLWFNWKEVVFEDIEFVAGRNDIELKFIPHNYTDTSQSSFSGKFTANIDSLKVTSAECEVTPYDLVINSLEVNGMKMTAGENGATYELTGKIDATYSVKELTKLLQVGIGNNTYTGYEMTIEEDGTFVITVSGVTLAIGEHALKFSQLDADGTLTLANLLIEEVETNVISVGYSDYEISWVATGNEGLGNVYVNVTSDASVDDYKPQSVSLEAGKDEEGKDIVYFVIKGNVNWTKYAVEDVAQYLNAMMEFDFQGDLAVGGSTRYLNTAAVRLVTVEAGEEEGKGTFTMKVDVSVLTGSKYSTHFGVGLGNLDYYNEAGKVEPAEVKTGAEHAVKIGHITYTLVYEPEYSNKAELGGSLTSAQRREHYYGCVGLLIESDQKFSAKGVSAALMAEDEQVYVTISGTFDYENYTEEELKEAIAKKYFDLQNNASHSDHTGSSWTTYKMVATADDVTLDMENKTYTVKYNVTEMGVSAYTVHYDVKADGKSAADIKPADAYDVTLTVGGKTYQLTVTPGGNVAQNFWGCPGLIIKDVPAE